MTTSTVRVILLLPILIGLSACGGTPNTSAPAQRQAVPPLHVDDADSQSFIDHTKQILATVDGVGEIEVSEFLNIMPMEDGQRNIILRSFTTPFAVTCANDECVAEAHGRAAEAIMDITINGISQPKLALARIVKTGMKIRGNGVEFCNIVGMSAKKFFVTRKVQGILMALPASGTTLVVNVDDDSENFNCD